MTTVRVKNITISGIVSVLPALEKVNADLLSSVGAQEMARIVSSPGIHPRRIVNPAQTPST